MSLSKQLWVQPQSQRQQTRISTHTQCRQDNNHLPARSKLLLAHTIIPQFTEELSVSNPPPVGADKHHCHAIDGEKGAHAVEFGCKDLEDDEGECKLGDSCADVGTLKGALSSADFDEPKRVVRKETSELTGSMRELLLGGEDDGAGAM